MVVNDEPGIIDSLVYMCEQSRLKSVLSTLRDSCFLLANSQECEHNRWQDNIGREHNAQGHHVPSYETYLEHEEEKELASRLDNPEEVQEAVMYQLGGVARHCYHDITLFQCSAHSLLVIQIFPEEVSLERPAGCTSHLPIAALNLNPWKKTYGTTSNKTTINMHVLLLPGTKSWSGSYSKFKV